MVLEMSKARLRSSLSRMAADGGLEGREVGRGGRARRLKIEFKWVHHYHQNPKNHTSQIDSSYHGQEFKGNVHKKG